MPDIDRYLNIRSAGGGRLTADASTLVFVTNVTGVPQAWAMPRGGGWPRQLTYADQRVAGAVPSPVDPGLVVFARDDGGNERMQLHTVDPSGAAERELVTNPNVIHRFGEFGPDGNWFVFCDNRRNGVDFDLYHRTIEGEERLVAELEGWNEVTDVAPDGSAALVAHFESNVDGYAWLIDLDTGEHTDLTPHTGPVFHVPVAFGPGGSVFVVSDRDGEFKTAYRLQDGEWEGFGPQDADVDGLVVDRGLGMIAWNDGGRTRAAWFDLRTLAMGLEVDLPLGTAGGMSVAPDGSEVALTISGPEHNADVWRIPAWSATPARVTRSDTAGIDPATFVSPDLVSVESFDGFPVPAWVYRPEGVERPPAIVSVHGGPEAQERPGFNPLYQYFVAAGFAVVAPNVRGSSGFGKTSLALDDKRKRMDSVADLNEVGRWVLESGDLDGSRMAVMGGSYGGFMVLAGLASAPDLWSAGVDIVGIANFVTFLENTGDYRRALREAEYGSLAEDREFLESISPTTMVDRIVAPLLVIHGANDPRVPLSEATQIVDRLRELDRVVELMVFDDEGHGLVKLANRKVAYPRVVDFLREHLSVPQ